MAAAVYAMVPPVVRWRRSAHLCAKEGLVDEPGCPGDPTEPPNVHADPRPWPPRARTAGQGKDPLVGPALPLRLATRHRKVCVATWGHPINNAGNVCAHLGQCL